MLAHGGEIWAFAFSADASTMVSASLGEPPNAQPDTRRSLIVWDLRNRRPRGPPLSGHPTYVTTLALDRQGSRAVTGSGPEG